MDNNQTVSRKFWPKHVSWLTKILALLAIITFIVIANSSNYFISPPVVMRGGVMEDGSTGVMTPTSGGSGMMDYGEVSSAPSQGGMYSDMYYPNLYPQPYPKQDVPITDTREFLKVYYNAYMRTRNVQGLTQRVETTVRGYDGRIDQESSSEKSGFISFAVPQSKYNAFRTELESFVNKRFLTINISSENLLSQKLSIEEQQKQADTALANYKVARQKIVNAHTTNVASLQSQINSVESQLAILRAQPQTPQVIAQIQSLTSELSILKQKLDSENSSYATQLTYADRNIKSAEDWQKAVQTQDKALLDNVATVTGTISIQWISLWDSIRLYMPGYSISITFAVLAFLSLLYDRRRFGTV